MKKKFFLHSFLFASYPVLFLFSQNIQEFRVDVLFVPLISVLLVTALLFLVLMLILKKNMQVSAILTSYLVIILLYYNRILGQLDNLLPASATDVKTYYPYMLLIGFVVLARVLYKLKDTVININKLLTLVSIVLVVFPLFTILSYEVKTGRMLDVMQSNQLREDNVTAQTQENPDIYYVILDRYAGKTALVEEYDFDNSAFYTYLESQGFYVANEARANYPKTFLSLAASLNMEYMDEKTSGFQKEKGSDQSLITPFIRNNEVIRLLRDRGYTIVNVGSWWTPTQTNPSADINYYLKNKAYFGADEFTTGYVNTTIAAPYLKSLFKDPTAISDDPQNNIHRSTVLYEVNALKRAAEAPGPKFVFMHLALPHDPFVFDKNCTPINESIVRQNTHQENYIEQLQCANLYAKDIVDSIMKNSGGKAVIMLQSDEGPFPMNKPIPDTQAWALADTTSLREKFPILQTYFLPGNTKPEFYESISPVNSFRVVFNSIFGTTYPLLPDRSYVFQDGKNYYSFTDVTEKVK